MKSEPGVGTTMAFTLQLAVAETEAVAGTEPQHLRD